MAQCTFIKPDGQQCSANAILGADLCFTHNPDLEEARMIAVRKGGLNRRLNEVYGEAVSVQTPADIKKLLGDTINAIITGKMPASQPANAIGFLARCWIDIHQIAEQEERMEALEKKLEKLKI